MNAYRYRTNCVNSTAALICPMVDAARSVTWETFKAHVPVREVQSVFPHYSYRGEHRNAEGEQVAPLHIKNDYAVSFHRSMFDGERCYYIRHSAIEYIFTQEQRHD